MAYNTPGLLSVVTQATNPQGNTPAANRNTAAVNPVNNQFIFSTGTQTLTTTPFQFQTQFIPNYNNLPLTSLKLALTVADTVASGSAPTGVQPIESAIQQLIIQTNDGINICSFNGNYLDISATARYVTAGGLYYASPTPADTTTSTTYTSTWNIIVPMSVKQDKFPLKCFVTFNTLASRATTLNSMTATASLSVFGNYSAHDFTPARFVNNTIPVSSTGNILVSNNNFLVGSTCLLQAYQYGKLSTTDATQDNAIGSTGNGITFTPDGSLNISNAPLQTFIDKENIAYPNSIATGSGHVYGMVNLFSDAFVMSTSSNLTIGFTSAPSVYGGTNQIRTIWVIAL